VKVALFGATGLLGWSIHQELKRRQFRSWNFCNQVWKNEEMQDFQSLDLVEVDKVTSKLLEIWPDAVINCAALSSPDEVNKNPKLGFKINVEASQRLAEISSHLGARYIHISSDMVFGGRKEPYRSTDQPDPQSLYGEQKVEAEKRVLAAVDENIVVLRTTLINGNSPKGNRSPHERIFHSIRDNKPLRLFDDEFRQPSSSENIASVVVELLERPNLNGLFHWAGSELITRYELGVRILERFGFKTEHITRASLKKAGAEMGSRPNHLALELLPLVGKLKTEPASIEAQLDNLQVPLSLYSWYRENADDPSKYILRL
jgi:dTDP-4-dehydrorhamnose reductase